MTLLFAVLVMALLLLLTVLPLVAVILFFSGYDVALVSFPIFSVTLAVLSLGAMILSLARDVVPRKRWCGVLAVLSVPLALISTTWYGFAAPSAIVISTTLVCLGCCCCFAVRYGPRLLMIVGVSITGALCLPILFVAFIRLAFGGLAYNTVVRSLPSPDGGYTAQVIDSDQGALGSNTFVDVFTPSSPFLGVFEISRTKRVYGGKWGQWETMTVYWEDEEHLVIDGVSHAVA